MSASIQDLESFRKKKEIKKQKENPEYQKSEFQRIVEYVLTEWEAAYYSGTFKTFISKKLNIEVDNIFDLNVIANVEKSLGMEVAIFYPKTLPHNMNGYIAGFNHSKFALATPEMASEAEARLVNILLFLEISEFDKAKVF